MAGTIGRETTKIARSEDVKSNDIDTPNSIIASLKLEPHLEGGHFKEIFRDTATDSTGRSRSTSIYYLLQNGQHSQLHRLDACEAWHHYSGGCLDIVEVDNDGPKVTKLGKSIGNGERPIYVVPAGKWFGAKPADGTDFVLAGCTVAPAFDFEKFEMGDREKLLAEFGDNPDSREWIDALLPKG